MLADRKIRHLLGQIAGITGIFLLILVLLAVLKCPALCMAAVSAVMAAAILAAVYRYFREQEKILENAAKKSGNTFPGITKPAFPATTRAACAGCSMRSIPWRPF